MACRLIAGCGYVGARVAKAWLAQGDKVFAFTRSENRSRELVSMGVIPIQWDWLSAKSPADSEAWRVLQGCIQDGELSTLLIAVSHAKVPELAYEQTHVLGLSNLWKLLESSTGVSNGLNNVRWLYLSTTGVFGTPSFGDWVDEQTEVSAKRPGAIAAWAGEQWISDRVGSERSVRLRPSGIYGPERVPRWESIRDQIPLDVDPESYLNLIHVDDLVSMISIVSNRRMESDLYVVSDQLPVKRGEYYHYIAEIGGFPSPVFAFDASSRPTESRARADVNKRLRNERIVSELHYRFQFPTFREGLRQLLADARGDPR